MSAENSSLKTELEKVMDDYQEALLEIQRQKQVEENVLRQIEDRNLKIQGLE